MLYVFNISTITKIDLNNMLRCDIVHLSPLILLELDLSPLLQRAFFISKIRTKHPGRGHCQMQRHIRPPVLFIWLRYLNRNNSRT